jgi:hypothetical protein
VISGVGDHDLTVTSGRHTLGSIQGTCQGVDKGEKGTLRIENLNSRIAPVGNNDVVLKMRIVFIFSEIILKIIFNLNHVGIFLFSYFTESFFQIYRICFIRMAGLQKGKV